MRLGLVALALGSAGAILACGSGLTFNPDTVTIHGRVVSAGLGIPTAPYWPVDRLNLVRAAEIGDALASSPATTDATGRFFTYGFGTTYDLTVARRHDQADLVAVRGLTRRDPVVALPLEGSLPLQSAHIDITWNVPPAAGTKVAYFLDGTLSGDTHFDHVGQVDDDPSHGVTVTWYGGAPVAGFLNVIVYTPDASGNPAAYVQSGVAFVTLVAGRSLSLALQAQSISTSPTTVAVTTPASDYVVDSLAVDVDHGNHSTSFTFAHLAPTSLPASTTLPAMIANRVVARGEAHHGGEISVGVFQGGATADQPLTATVDFPPAATITSPADRATDVGVTTPFAFAGDGVCEVIFTPVGSGPQVRFVTADKSVTLAMLPDTRAFVPGASYTWVVRRWPFVPTTDAFVDGNVELGATSSATTAPRTFTLKN